MIKSISALMLVSALSITVGCSTQYQAYSIKQGVTQQEINADDYACKRDSTFQSFSVVNGIAAASPKLDINLW